MDLKEVTADEKEQVWNEVCSLFHNADSSTTTSPTFTTSSANSRDINESLVAENG